MNENEIVKLLEQIKNGDERAFAEFYSQTYKYVYSRAKCMFSDEEEVQDLVQEVYLAVYRNIGSLEVNESIFAWLRTTTFYQGTKMLKKKRKEVLLSEDGEEMFESIPDDEPEIEEGYMNQEDVQVIRECINRLSDEQKTVLLAYYYDNLKVNEIAEILSLSVGTIKSRLYLARKNLQVHIEEEEKKRGYKLHSFGAVSLALALRMFLQGNMELAGSVEETIFARVCQGLNFEVSKAVAAQSGLAEQVVQEGTKQAGKGILGKLGVLGAKKVAISVVGIIAAVAIGITAVVNSKQDNEENESSQVSEYAQNLKELQQWQIDYAKILFMLDTMPGEVQRVTMADSLFQESLLEYLSENFSDGNMTYSRDLFWGLHDSDLDGEPELYIEFKDVQGNRKSIYMFKRGECIEECYVGKVDLDVKLKTCYVSSENILEQLQINISKQDEAFLRCVGFGLDTIMLNREVKGDYEVARVAAFGSGKKSNYVLVKDTVYYILTGEEWDFYGYANPSTEYFTFSESHGKVLEHRETDDSVVLEVHGMYNGVEYETGCVIEKNYIASTSGNVEVKYQYTDVRYEFSDDEYDRIEDEWKEITEEEYLKMYNDYCDEEISLYDGVEYEDVLERLYKIKINLDI